MPRDVRSQAPFEEPGVECHGPLVGLHGQRVVARAQEVVARHVDEVGVLPLSEQRIRGGAAARAAAPGELLQQVDEEVQREGVLRVEGQRAVHRLQRPSGPARSEGVQGLGGTLGVVPPG